MVEICLLSVCFLFNHTVFPCFHDSINHHFFAVCGLLSSSSKPRFLFTRLFTS